MDNFDFLADIDKIQNEIEKDLAKADELLVSAQLEIQEDVIVHEPIVAETPDNMHLPRPHSGFYREVVKDEEPPRKPFFNSWGKVAAFLLICTLGTGSLGFGVGAGVSHFNRVQEDILIESPRQAEISTLTTVHYTFENVESGYAGSIADIIEMLEPSVVSISAYFDGIFGRPGQGSGIIFAENDERVFIVTNNYVVSHSPRVTVSISGSEPLEARPVGSDFFADLNVISVDKSQLLEAGIDHVVIATFGDSSQMRVGDTVLAIGNAMGEGNSVTRGVISAQEAGVYLHGRDLPIVMLQTDAAINYGNSGGPLINTRGEVIGININQASNMILGGMSQVEGMGFSISSNEALPILNRLINYRRPGLGITGTSVNEDIAREYGVAVLGVYVHSVIEGQAAYHAGLLAADIITGFNGAPVFNFEQLVEAISGTDIGETVEMRILRDGTTAMTLTVELGAFIQANF